MKKYILILLVALFATAGVSLRAATPKTKTGTVTYIVNMHCDNCQKKLTDKLSFLRGVQDCDVSLKNKTVNIVYDPAKVNESRFVETITKLGYTADKVKAADPKKPTDAK